MHLEEIRDASPEVSFLSACHKVLGAQLVKIVADSLETLLQNTTGLWCEAASSDFKTQEQTLKKVKSLCSKINGELRKAYASRESLLKVHCATFSSASLEQQKEVIRTVLLTETLIEREDVDSFVKKLENLVTENGRALLNFQNIQSLLKDQDRILKEAWREDGEMQGLAWADV